MKVALVIKRTSYRKFVIEDQDPLIARLLAREDFTVSRLKRSHDAHEACVREVKSTLKTLGATVIYADGPYGKIPHADLVITIGGDGTLLAASHQIGAGIPLLGVNSAPESSVGFFSAAKGGQIGRVLRAALAGKLQATALTRMQVDLNGKTVHARVLNEALVCHTSPAATSRYILSITKKKKTASEDQRSSGIWIGPAAGSTAAQRSAGGKVLPLLSSKLQYVVREPYTPIGKRLKLRVGLVDPDGYLELRSKMREAKMFLDGHNVAHDVTLGDIIVMRRSAETLSLLGLAKKRQ